MYFKQIYGMLCVNENIFFDLEYQTLETKIQDKEREKDIRRHVG